jgi:glycosyltransferase involved in cell wall biosynthesis
MDISPDIIIDKLNSLPMTSKRRVFYNEHKDIAQQAPAQIHSKAKLTMPIIVLNEERNLPRFIELVTSHTSIGRVVAIDGGSTDKTVELLEKAGAEVYVHPYIKTYHDQQAMQRNISCSYVANGEPVFIMDIDECFSKELSDYLPFLAEQRAQRYGLVYRKTFNYFADINDDSKRIKDWPDPQPRYYVWDWSFKFVGGAHHITLNVPPHFIIDKPILHFEKEGKNRDDLESQWSNMMNGVRKYNR